MADEIWRWTAARIAAAVASREISAREAVASCVAPQAEKSTAPTEGAVAEGAAAALGQRDLVGDSERHQACLRRGLTRM